jgi:hypothetical protein
MSAGIYDIYIEQGATYNQPLVWKDSSGTAVNVTGYTARMQIRKTVDATTIILTLTTENGRITVGGSNGLITLLVSAADTAALTTFCGVYDLEVISPAGVVTRLLEGQVEVSKEVTR